MVTIDKNLVSQTNMVLSGTCLRLYYEVRHVFKFFHKISDFKLDFCFQISNFTGVSLRLVHLIIFVFLFLVHLFTFPWPKSRCSRPLPVWAHHGGVGGLWLPLPHPKTLHILAASLGGSMWVSNGLLVWSISDLGGGGGMQYNRLVFQAWRHFRSMYLGGYCRL